LQPSPIKVSVILPLHQSTRYLGETLDSLSKQTCLQKNPEILETLIIVDGECEEFFGKIPSTLSSSIRIIKIPHRGVSGARNYGIENALGKFIAFLDADDLWLPEKLERQLDVMAAHPEAGMIYTNSFWIDKKGHTLSRTQKEQYGHLPTGDIAFDMMERDYIITSSVLIPKNVFDRVGLFDSSLEVCEDWEMKIRIAKSFPVLAIDEPLISYRLHPGGSHYKCEKMLECGYSVFDRHAKDFNGKVKTFRSNISLNLAGSWLYIDRPEEARRYLKESRNIKGWGARLILMYILSFMPKFTRDMILWVRDKIAVLP
jgi:glycosyltransferase involved in cell wall biosynthesis